MIVQENISLQPYNTFGIDVNARYFARVTTIPQLKELLADDRYPNPFIIGGGSNMLLTRDVDRLVILLDLQGIETVNASQSDTEVYLRVAAGVNWDEFVVYCIKNDYGGVENLSLIPGNVGTSPIQNIGAYGVELKDVFYECTAVHRESQKERISVAKFTLF